MEFTATLCIPTTLQKKHKGKYVLKKKDPSKQLTWMIFFVFALAFLYFTCFICTYKWDQIDLVFIMKYMTKFFDFVHIPSITYGQVFTSLLNTIILAFMTTVIGAFVGLLLGLLAARNLSHPLVSNVIRGFAGFIRAVPTIIWVLLFIAGYGLSSTTAIVGMCFHSVAYFIKAYSEAFEEIDQGALEALRSTGARWGQIVLSAVIPVSFTKMISWIAMRCEMNFAAAVIIGPAVGVPGTIGSILNSYQRAGNYGTVGFCTILIFLIAFLFEFIITRYKQNSIISD